MSTVPTVPGHASSTKELRRVAGTSLIGTAIEWYDFNIYGTAAVLVFGKQFFPSFSPAAGTLAAFATFGVGFLARPLGGVIMGHYGDRVGRKSMLVTSLLLMGCATFAVGLLPNYATIGAAAPVLLVALRFIQGVGVGGEWGGAVLIAVEHAPPTRRTLYGSFAQMGNPLGVASATVVFIVLSVALRPDELVTWGWRIPFLLSATLVVFGMVMRLRIEESPAFTTLRRTERVCRTPLLELLRTCPGRLLAAGIASTAPPALGYLLFVYLVSYGRDTLQLSTTLMLWLVVAASLTWALLIAPAALLAERIGRKPVFLAGLLLSALWAFPFFALIDSRSVPAMLLAYLVAAVGIAAFTGVQATLIAELFPTNIRYSGASVAYQVGSILGGALAPIIATTLLASTRTAASIAGYIVGLTVLSILAAHFVTEPPDQRTENLTNTLGN
jgi:MFS family permease